jgi:hypothetical protein
MVTTTLAGEQAVPVSEVLGLLPGDIPPPTLSTVYRWCDRGVGGVRLRSWRRGGRLFTSAEALGEFLAALNRVGADGPEAPRAKRPGEGA